MLDVFLCHAAADRGAASAIAARLERGAEARVWREESASVNTAWEYGLSSAAILLLLSPDSVPARVVREDWEGLLGHVGAPAAGAVLLRTCGYPRLLERRPFWRWGASTLRDLERWVLSLHPQDRPRFEPARLPWFEGRSDELAELWEALVDAAGCCVLVNAERGSGKTCLAQHFARSAGEHFRDVVWVDCAGRPAASVRGEIAARLQATGAVESVLREHRLLLVLDDLDRPMPVFAGGRTSVLVTTRHELDLQAGARVMRLAPAARPAPGDAGDPRLWCAMSVCRRNDVPLALAARIAGLDSGAAQAACERLVAARAIDPFDAERQRFRLAARPEADLEELRKRHAAELRASFARWRQNPAECLELLAEAEAAFDWAAPRDWPLATTLAFSVFALLESQGRLAEAAEVCDRLRSAALERNDARIAAECAWRVSWIRNEGGDMRPLPVVGEQLMLF